MKFEESHLKSLKDLFLELGFSGAVLPGKFGANSYTVMDLLHTVSITTLQGLLVQLKKDISAYDELDDWSCNVTIKQKTEDLAKWKEFVFLVIGYKKFTQEESEKLRLLKKDRAEKLATLSKVKEVKEIDEMSKLSLEELNAKIAELS